MKKDKGAAGMSLEVMNRFNGKSREVSSSIQSTNLKLDVIAFDRI